MASEEKKEVPPDETSPGAWKLADMAALAKARQMIGGKKPGTTTFINGQKFRKRTDGTVARVGKHITV